MKKLVLIGILFALFSRCTKEMDGCNGPDRLVFVEAKAAFLESGLVLLEMKQDTSWPARIPYWTAQPCGAVDFSHYKTQKDNGSITPNYQLSCGIKYAEQGRVYTNVPTLRIAIYSVKPL